MFNKPTPGVTMWFEYLSVTPNLNFWKLSTIFYFISLSLFYDDGLSIKIPMTLVKPVGLDHLDLKVCLLVCVQMHLRSKLWSAFQNRRAHIQHTLCWVTLCWVSFCWMLFLYKARSFLLFVNGPSFIGACGGCLYSWERQTIESNGTACIRHQCTLLSCHRFLINSSVEKMKNI